MTHICVSKLTIIGSDNSLSPERRQANIWTNAGILLIGTLGTNFNEILSETHTFSFKKMHLKTSSAKRWPCCLGLNVLMAVIWYIYGWYQHTSCDTIHMTLLSIIYHRINNDNTVSGWYMKITKDAQYLFFKCKIWNMRWLYMSILDKIILLYQAWWSLQWRHNEHNGISNHQPDACLLNHLFRCSSKETSKLRITGLCAGNSPVTVEFPAQRASNTENVSIGWRHHDDFNVPVYPCIQMSTQNNTTLIMNKKK